VDDATSGFLIGAKGFELAMLDSWGDEVRVDEVEVDDGAVGGGFLAEGHEHEAEGGLYRLALVEVRETLDISF
jgi:hypothetical protein